MDSNNQSTHFQNKNRNIFREANSIVTSHCSNEAYGISRTRKSDKFAPFASKSLGAMLQGWAGHRPEPGDSKCPIAAVVGSWCEVWCDDGAARRVDPRWISGWLRRRGALRLYAGSQVRLRKGAIPGRQAGTGRLLFIDTGSAGIMQTMKSTRTTPVLDQLISPLGDCLTSESARRILELKADAKLQSRVDDLAQRHSQGLLSPEEQAEYGKYVSYRTFVAILKSKARQLLASSQGD